MSINPVNRRDFLKLTGLSSSGLVLGGTVGLGVATTSLPAWAKPAKSAKGLLFNVFVQISPEDQVFIIAHRSEMGTGIKTSLPQVLADELEADWQKVEVIQGQANNDYGSQNTDGSRSIRDFYSVMRQMGASAKWMLCKAAADLWQVPMAECQAKNHRVIHTPSNRQKSFGELAIAAAAVKAPDVTALRFKKPSEFNYIGKPVPQVDLEAMLTGQTEFGVDIRRPNMLIASIERSPVLGGQIKRVQSQAAKKIAGVVDVIEIPGTANQVGFHPIAGVAVLAENTWSAQKGREALDIEWQSSEHDNYNTEVFGKELLQACQQPLNTGKLWRKRGNAVAELERAEQTFEASYLVPHWTHAPMEPPMATAEVTEAGCEIWACVQVPQSTRDTVAAALGLKPEQVVVNVTLLGGGFGRKSKPDFAVEAALLAKASGRPVKVCWTREDDIQHSYYHAINAQRYHAVVDQKGFITALSQQVAAPTIMSTFVPGAQQQADWEIGQGFANLPYDIEHIHAESLPVKAHTRIGWMRAVYNVSYAFAANSFIDELARKYGHDPLEYQLNALGKDRVIDTQAEGFDNFAYGKSAQEYPMSVRRLKQAILAVKKSAGWPQATGKHEGWGIAAHPSFLSYVAVASKVRLVKTSASKPTLEVLEVHIAIDAGQLVNPDRVHAQMEGSVIFALSSGLYGEVPFKDGQVQVSNFHDYSLLRVNQTPKIVVTLIDSDEKHTGVGEPGVPPVIPSITSAIVAAGGVRIRQLPIKKYLTV